MQQQQQRGAGWGGILYFIGFIIALVYYVPGSVGVEAVVFAVVKATLWPAMLVLELLTNYQSKP